MRLHTRKKLIKRGLLLIAIGLLYAPVWQADILHFYGFYFLIAAFMYELQDRKLLLASLGFTLMFPLLLVFFNYDLGWDWATMEYQDFWTASGMIRHIFFNGLHPVFPWCSFLLFGIWLGRLPLQDKELRVKLFCLSLLLLLSTESSCYLIKSLIQASPLPPAEIEELNYIFSTASLPPMPAYIISAGSSSLLIILLSLHLSETFSESKLTQWLSYTGQLSLTLYLVHVLVGLGLLEAMGRLENQSIEFSLLCSGIFCVTSVAFSTIWRSFSSTGPLEWFFRKLAR